MQQTGHFRTKAKAGVDVGEPNPARLMELQNRASTQIPGCTNFLLLLELVLVKSEEGGWPITVGLLSSGWVLETGRPLG